MKLARDMKPEEILDEARELMATPNVLGDQAGLIAKDSRLTQLREGLIIHEVNAERGATMEQVKCLANKSSVASSEVAKEATLDYYHQQIYKLTREAILEHLRGIRPHIKQPY